MTIFGGFGGGIGGTERSVCVRELQLARALVVCGDEDGLGYRTLLAYADDPRGVYAENARAFLSAHLLYPRAGVRVDSLCKGRVTTTSRRTRLST